MGGDLFDCIEDLVHCGDVAQMDTSKKPRLWFNLLIQSVPAAMEGLMARQLGLFDLDERYAALSKNGDPLERLSAVVDFEVFRDDLDVALKRSDGSRGGVLRWTLF